MTTKEFDRFKLWSKTNSCSGWILLYPSAIKLFKKPGLYMVDQAKKKHDLFVACWKGILVGEDSITFKHEYTDASEKTVSQKIKIPYKSIKKMSISGYNRL